MDRPPHTYFLILGRASATLQGINVLPSLVDNDYTGEIKILASCPKGVLVIHKGQRIAQALPLPLDSSRPPFGPYRGPSNPGSSDIYWIQKITSERPSLQLKINGKMFSGLLDSGADTTVLSLKFWPKTWPCHPSSTHLQGIGISQSTLISSEILTWEDPDKNTGQVQPYIVPNLPINLWGRDIMTQMGVYLFSPSTRVSQQMLDQGLLPGQGLGKQSQGILEPISITPKKDKRGLGHPDSLLNSHFS